MKLLLNGVHLGIEVQCALTWPSRAMGLLGTQKLLPNRALWLRPCASIHTMGMRYSIDVVFLDRQGRVKKIVSQLSPFRWAACRQADSVIEFGSGLAERLGLQVGDQLKAG
jgi:uncharacterized membrane protein (UPF0127 family)